MISGGGVAVEGVVDCVVFEFAVFSRRSSIVVSCGECSMILEWLITEGTSVMYHSSTSLAVCSHSWLESVLCVMTEGRGYKCIRVGDLGS